MPIAITEVQRDLRDSIRSRAAEFDTAEIRAGTSGNRWWKGLAEQGVFAVALPERCGGAGAGVAEVAAALDRTGYLPDEGIATAAFLALKMRRPLLCEGEPGTGKTALAHSLAASAPG